LMSTKPGALPCTVQDMWVHRVGQLVYALRSVLAILLLCYGPRKSFTSLFHYVSPLAIPMNVIGIAMSKSPSGLSDFLDMRSNLEGIRVLLVGRGLSSLSLAELDGKTTVIAANPSEDVLAILRTLETSFYVLTEDAYLSNAYRKMGLSVIELSQSRRASEILMRVNNDTFSIQYNNPVSSQDNQQTPTLAHYLGPLATAALGCLGDGKLEKIIGWDQYIEAKTIEARTFRRFRAVTGTGSIQPILPSESNDTGPNSKGSFKTWCSNFVYRYDIRHATRNFVNIWLCRSLIDAGVKIEGNCVWAANIPGLDRQWQRVAQNAV